MLRVADYLTIGNFICGLIAIFLAILGHFGWSCLLAIGAMAFDFMDGKVARMLKQESLLGKELDSLADLVSFGVWPAVLGFALGLDDALSIAAMALFSAAGMLRLARFNVTSSKDFEGVPITANGLLFPLLYFGLDAAGISWGPAMLFVYLLMGVLMVSTFKVRKL
jgi:CDP-diacylglycerol--serine O-phosphatidyltransferase